MNTTTPEQLHEQWVAALAARDLGRLVALCEPDALVAAVPGAPPVCGASAVTRSVAWLLALDGTLRAEPWVGVEHGDLAGGSARFTICDGHDPFEGVPVTVQGSSLEVMRREHGRWRYAINVALHPAAHPRPLLLRLRRALR